MRIQESTEDDEADQQILAEKPVVSSQSSSSKNTDDMILINGSWVDKNSPQAKSYLAGYGLAPTESGNSQPVTVAVESKPETLSTIQFGTNPIENAFIGNQVLREVVKEVKTQREAVTLSTGEMITDAYDYGDHIMYETYNKNKVGYETNIGDTKYGGITQSDYDKLKKWTVSNDNSNDQSVKSYLDSVVHPSKPGSPVFITNSRGIAVPKGSVYDDTVSKPLTTIQTVSGKPIGDSIISGNEPIITGPSTFTGKPVSFAIIGSNTLVGVSENDMDKNSSRYLPAYDKDYNLIKNAFYDTEEKAINIIGTSEYTGKKYGELPYNVKPYGPTGQETLITGYIKEFYDQQNKNNDNTVSSAYGGVSDKLVSAGLFSSDNKMRLNNNEYSDPLNSVGIFKTGEAITNLGNAPKQFAGMLAGFVFGGSILHALNEPVYVQQRAAAGMVGTFVSGLGAGIGLTEAAVQDASKGNIHTLSKGFTGGILGEPTKITREYDYLTNQRVDYVDESGKIVRSEFSKDLVKATAKETKTLDMPNLGEQLVIGVSPSLYDQSKGYLKVKDNLTITDISTGVAELGVNAGLIYAGVKSGVSTKKGFTTDFKNTETLFAKSGDIRSTIDTKPNNMPGVKEIYTIEDLGVKNTETGESLPWNKNDLTNREGISTSLFKYDRETPIVGTTKEFVSDVTVKGRTEWLTESGEISTGHFENRVFRQDITEPDIRSGFSGSGKGLPKDLLRDIDAAPKTSDEQFISKPVNPNIEELTFESGKVNALMDDKRGWKKTYTVDNYLAGNPLDLLFERRTRIKPGTSIPEIETIGKARTGTPQLFTSGSLVSNMTKNTGSIAIDFVKPKSKTVLIDDSTPFIKTAQKTYISDLLTPIQSSKQKQFTSVYETEKVKPIQKTMMFDTNMSKTTKIGRLPSMGGFIPPSMPSVSLSNSGKRSGKSKRAWENQFSSLFNSKLSGSFLSGKRKK